MKFLPVKRLVVSVRRRGYLVLFLLIPFAVSLSAGLINRWRSATIKNAKTILLSPKILSCRLLEDSTRKLATSLAFSEKSRYKVLCLIDGSCSSCVQKMINWRGLIDSEGLECSDIIFIGFDAEPDKLVSILKEVVKGNLNIYLDNDDAYGSLNSIDLVNQYETVLIDEHMRVIEHGDPFENSSLLHSYVHYLKS